MARTRRFRWRFSGREALVVVAVSVGLVALMLAWQTSSASAASLRPMMLPPPPPSCPAVTFIGARGSGESFNRFDGMGAAVDRMAGVLGSALAKHRIGISDVPVFYPADSVSDLKPSGAEIALLLTFPPIGLEHYLNDYLGKYLRSIATGVSDTASLVQGTVATCPGTKVVLAGYSQGAMVIHQAEPRLSGRLRRHIWGTLLLGDGDRAPFTRAKEFGSSPPRAEGIQVYLHAIAARDVPLPASTANICNAGDIVCDFNLDRVLHFSQAARVHTSYALNTRRGIRYSPLLAKAANWLAGRIIAHEH